jgi:hypothetical protein
MKKNKSYVVIAYKWGCRDEHSYLVGCYCKKAKAIKIADEEVKERGGKYTCDVEEVEMDKYDPDNIGGKTVYVAKGVQVPDSDISR